MKTVTAREANHRLSSLLARVEKGEEIVITRHGEPVAVLSPYRASAITAERQAAIRHAIATMGKGLPWCGAFRTFSRDEMHEG
jgi:prevent-host-death family protein